MSFTFGNAQPAPPGGQQLTFQDTLNHYPVSGSTQPGDSKAGAVASNPFASMFASPVVRVVVDSAKKEYNLHEGVLALKTPYFASLLRSGLKEAQDRSVEMSTEVDREDAFEKYVEYLYTDEYSVPDDLETACILHARVHALADRLCMDELKKSSAHKLQKLLLNTYRSPVASGPGAFGGAFGSAQASHKPLISVDTLISLASIIYNHTVGPPKNIITISDSFGSPQRSGFGSGTSNKRNVSGDGRRIVSQYTASRWSSFRLDEKMRKFMDENTDFAFDVLFSTGDGAQL